MQEIGKFFSKFKSVVIKEIQNREIICDAILKETKQKIDINDISIRNGIVQIKGSQSLKSEIFLKKKAILGLLKSLKIIDIK